MTDNWLVTDEAEDVAGSIRHALRAGDFVSEDPQSWKWVALALHSALQGACVCHLTTTAAPVGAVTDHNANQWLAFLRAPDTGPKIKPPKTYLMNLPDLIRSIGKPGSAGDQRTGSGIAISDSEVDWLRRFHDGVRNRFMHFEPMGWSLEISGLPDIARLIARIMEEIVDAGWAFRHQDVNWREDLRRNLRRLASNEWRPDE